MPNILINYTRTYHVVKDFFRKKFGTAFRKSVLEYPNFALAPYMAHLAPPMCYR